MLPILGALAGAAGRMALGAVSRQIVSKAATSTLSGAARTGGRRAAGGKIRRMAAKRMARRRVSGKKMHEAYGKFGTFRKRFRAMRRASLSQPRQSSQSVGGGFFNNQNPQRGFSSVGSSQIDTALAQQAISQFGNALAKASLITGAFTGAIGVAVTAVKALQGFASVLVDSQRGTARYSGTMSAAAAGLEVGRIGREMSQAGATASSFAKLTSSLDKLERVMQPFRAAFTAFLNTGISELVGAVTPLVQLVGRLLPSAQSIERYMEESSIKAEALLTGELESTVRSRRDQQKVQEQDSQRFAAQQNFNDLLKLRANAQLLNALNKPAPGIPSQPVKGAGRQRRQPVRSPIVNPFLLIQPNQNP